MFAWLRMRPEPQPVNLSVTLSGVEAFASAFEAQRAAHSAEVRALVARIEAAEARVASYQAHVDALHSVMNGYHEHAAHVTTRVNSLTGLVNRTRPKDEPKETGAPIPAPPTARLPSVRAF